MILLLVESRLAIPYFHTPKRRRLRWCWPTGREHALKLPRPSIMAPDFAILKNDATGSYGYSLRGAGDRLGELRRRTTSAQYVDHAVDDCQLRLIRGGREVVACRRFDPCGR